MSNPRVIPVGEEFSSSVPTKAIRSCPHTTSVAPMTSHRGNDNARNRASGRVHDLNDFVDKTVQCLKDPTAAVVWLVMFRDAHARTNRARAAQSDIARRVGRGVRTVRDKLHKLESLGLLKVTHRGGLNRGMTEYEVVPTLPTEQQRQRVAG